MAERSTQKFDRHSSQYDYDDEDDEDDLDYEESSVVPVKLESPPISAAVFIDESVKYTADRMIFTESFPKKSYQLKDTECKEEVEEILLDDSSSNDMFEERMQSFKPEASKSSNGTVLRPQMNPMTSDSPLNSSVTSQRKAVSSAANAQPNNDELIDFSDGEENNLIQEEQDGFFDPSKVTVFRMIDFSLFDKVAETRACSSSSTDLDKDLPAQSWTEDGNFKRMQTTARQNDLLASGLDGELLTFPSQAFLLSGGMGFISRSTEMQREATLLSFRLAGTLQAIARAVRRFASQPSGHLHATLRRLASGEEVSNLLADTKGYSTAQMKLLSTLAEEPHLLRRSESGVLYHGKKLLLLGDSLCPVFQCFTSQFVLRNVKPVLQMLQDEYVLASKTVGHTNCGCLTNPLLKLSQVERNIPLRTLSTWFRDRAALSSAHGRLTEQLALLGRGRRPTKVVVLVDGSLYPGSIVQNLVPFPCETSRRDNLDFLTHANTIKEDATLYVVLAGAGAMLEALPHIKFASNDSSAAEKSSDATYESTASAKAPRPGALADHLIESALLLWRTVLCSTTNSDVLFAPLPLIADPSSSPSQHPVPNTPLQRLSCRYNAWVRLQQRATGRAAPLTTAPASNGADDDDDEGEASDPNNPLPTVADLKEQLQTIMAQVQVDLNSNKSLLPIGRLRPPSLKKFSSVLLVLEESFVNCVSSYLRHLPELKVCPVPCLTAASSKAVASAALAIGDCPLVLLLPSWLRADTVVPLVTSKGPKGGSVFRCLGKNVDVIGRFGEQVTGDLRELMSSVRDHCPRCSVTVLPCLPLHLLRLTNEQQGIQMCNKLTNNSSSQVVLLDDKACAKLPLSYSTCNKQVYELAVHSFVAEDLHSEALEKMGAELEAFDSSLVTESSYCPDPASYLFGPFGSLLSSVVFSCKNGFPDEKLPSLAAITFNATYPDLTHLAKMDAKALRYNKIVFVGNTAINQKLQLCFTVADKVTFLQSVPLMPEAWNSFLNDVSVYPPNTLFIFLLDTMMMCSSEVYPECIKKLCPDKILRYSLPPVNFFCDQSVEEYVRHRVKLIYDKIRFFKESLPNQSSVLVAPMAPQCVLRQEDNISYFNHILLHATFFTPTNRHPMVFKGEESSWQKLYEYTAAALKQPCHVVDVGLENMVKSMTSKLEQKLIIVNNPRLCDDQVFPERDSWVCIMAELVLRVQKLVFPVTGISDEDKALIPIIERCSVAAKPSTPLPSLLLPCKPQTICKLNTPPEGWLSQPCTLKLDADRVNLPRSFVHGVCSYFNPVEDSFKKATPSGWLVTLPDMMRAALLRTILHDFRCIFFLISVTTVDSDKPLPNCPPDELKRLRAAMLTLLGPFALSCSRLFYHTFQLDGAFTAARKAECDFVEGLDATLCYLHKELRYLHVYHQQDILQGSVLVVVMVESAETAGMLATELQQALRDPLLYPPAAAGRLTPSIVSRDSSNNSGNVLLGTPRFVLALLRALSPPHALHRMQLLVIEEIKNLMTTEQKMPLLHVIQLARAAHAESGVVRPVVVCKELVREELSGANTVLGRAMRLVRRDDKGNGFIEEYDPSSLPSVTIKMPANMGAISSNITPGGLSNIPPAGPSNIRPGGPSNIRPGGPSNIRPSGPSNIRPSGPSNIRPGGPSNIRPGGPSNIRPGGPSNIRPPGVSNICPRPPFVSMVRFGGPNGQAMPPHLQAMRPGTPVTGSCGRPPLRPMAPGMGVVRAYTSPTSFIDTSPPPNRNMKALMASESCSTDQSKNAALGAPGSQNFLTSASTGNNVINRIMTSGTTIPKACNVNSKYSPASLTDQGFSAHSGGWAPTAAASQYTQPVKTFTGTYAVPPRLPGATTSGEQSSWPGGPKGNVANYPSFMPSMSSPAPISGVQPPTVMGYNQGQYYQTRQHPPWHPAYSQVAKTVSGYTKNSEPVPENTESSKRPRSRSRSRSRSLSKGRYSRRESRYHSRSRSRSTTPGRRRSSRSYSRSPSRSRYRSRSPVKFSRHEVKTSVKRDDGGSSVRRDVAITIKSNSRTVDGKTIERYERIRQKVNPVPSAASYSSRGIQSLDWHSQAGTSSGAGRSYNPGVSAMDGPIQDEDGTLQEYGEDIDTPTLRQKEVPPRPSFRSAREAIIRSELEDRYKVYADEPENHPQYLERRNRFFDLYAEQIQSGRGNIAGGYRHKEAEWRKAWKGLLSDMLEKEVEERMNETRASPSSGNGNQRKDESRKRTERRADYEDERSWQQTRAMSSSRDRMANTMEQEDDSTAADESSSITGIDLDPKALAQRTRGLNTVELALLLKQLVAASKLPCPDVTFKRLLKQVSALHMEYAQRELGFD